jgi:hypothetical protein
MLLAQLSAVQVQTIVKCEVLEREVRAQQNTGRKCQQGT